MNWHLFQRAFLFTVLTAVFSLPLTARAAIVANFDAGNTTSSVDGFNGMSGSGWNSAWITKTDGATITAATVTNVSVLTAGAGNYFNFGYSSPGSLSSTSGGISRQYGGGTSGVTLTQTVQYSFLFRPEITSTDYRYTFFDATAAQPSTGSNCTWTIVGTSSGWQWINGDRAGGQTTVSSGVSVISGDTYLFTVTANASTGMWTGSVQDLTAGGQTITSSTLGFRSSASTLGGYLTFGVSDGNPSTAGTYGFSVDSISIVPEPTTMALSLMALLIGWTGRRAARRRPSA